jgi:hypothetical protein
MYVKPQLERFGSVRELTQLGLDRDCDGGIHGIGDGTLVGCYDSGRS